MGPPPDPRTLLAQTGWVRRLARRLCTGDSEADDVSQEALRLALQRGATRLDSSGHPAPDEEPRRLRAWLATTVRTLSRTMPRAERRRATRERTAVQRGHQFAASAADVVARAEEHDRVVRAVLALDEPLRRTLLARYFDGEDSATIAAREGVSAAAARKRLQRGLTTLRARLVDDSDDPQRSRRALAALALGLPGGAPPPEPVVAAGGLPPVLGVLLMKRILSAAVVLVVLALGAAALWPESASGRPGADRDRLAARGGVPPATLGEGFDTPGRQLLTDSLDGSGGVAASEPTPDPRYGSLRVEARWQHDGSPAVERRLAVVAHGAREAHPAVPTDQRGIARYPRLAPGRYFVRHDVFSMRTVIVHAAEETRLAMHVTRPPGVRGRALDRDGRSVAGVEVSWRDDQHWDGGTTETDSDGAFHFDEVASNIYVHGRLGDRWFRSSPDYLSLMLPGETRSVELIEAALTPGRDDPVAGPTGVIVLRVEDPSSAELDGVSFHISGPAGSDWSRRATPDGGDATCRVEGVPAGPVRITPVRGLQRGEVLEAEVVANEERRVDVSLPRLLRLCGTVADSDGLPVAGAVVQLFKARSTSSSDATVAETISLADGSLESEPLWPGDFVVRTSHPRCGRDERRFQWDPEGDRRLQIDFSRAPTIRGRLVDPRGEPLADWIVTARARANHEIWTAADGCFEIAVEERVGHRLTARDPTDPDAHLIERLAVENVEPGPEQRTFVVPDETRATAWILGSLTDANTGRPPSSYHVTAYDEPAGQSAPAVPVDPGTGRFRIGPLPPGNWTLFLDDGRREAPSLQPGPFTLSAHQELEIPPVTIPSHGTLRVRVEPPRGISTDASRVVVRLYDEDGAHLSNMRQSPGDPLLFETYTAVPAGPARVACFGEGLHQIDRPLTIEPGQNPELILRPRPGRRTWIRIPPPEPTSRSSLLRILVVAEATGEVITEGERYVTRDGDHVLDLAPGRYRIEVEHPSGPRGTGVLEAGAGTAEQPIEVHLR